MGNEKMILESVKRLLKKKAPHDLILDYIEGMEEEE